MRELRSKQIEMLINAYCGSKYNKSAWTSTRDEVQRGLVAGDHMQNKSIYAPSELHDVL